MSRRFKILDQEQTRKFLKDANNPMAKSDRTHSVVTFENHQLMFGPLLQSDDQALNLTSGEVRLAQGGKKKSRCCK